MAAIAAAVEHILRCPATTGEQAPGRANYWFSCIPLHHSIRRAPNQTAMALQITVSLTCAMHAPLLFAPTSDSVDASGS